MKRHIHVLLGASTILLAAHTAMAQEKPVVVFLDMEDAITQALEKGPDAARIEALNLRAKGLRLSGEVRPNPELGFEMENFGGGTPQSGTDRAELTYSLSQRLELGGKRSKRLAAADAGAAANQLMAEALRRELARDVRVAYVEVLAADRNFQLAEEQARLARKLSDAAGRRVEAGRESEVTRVSAEVTAQQAELALTNAKVAAQQARRSLAALMGRANITLPLDAQVLEDLPPVPPVADATQAPHVRSVHLAARQADEGLRLARAEGIPDPTISMGVRQFRETDSEAFVVGLSVPIPVFDSNRGGVAQARADVNEAKAEAERAALAAVAEAERLAILAASSHQQIEQLRSKVLPAVLRAGKSLASGYEEGRFTLLDVLNGQRALQDAQNQLLQTQLTYHRAVAGLNRLRPVVDNDNSGE